MKAPAWREMCIRDRIKAAFEAENEGVTVELTIDKNLEDVISPDMKAGNYQMCIRDRVTMVTITMSSTVF